MTFSERMKDLFDQGVAASKEFALKAGAKAQDLGERGILMLEVKQLEGQAQKLVGRLGNEAYKAFAERNQDSLDKNLPEVDALLAEIAKVREAIEQKETDLRNRRS
jgi:predicted hydrocarbon binding protein